MQEDSPRHRPRSYPAKFATTRHVNDCIALSVLDASFDTTNENATSDIQIATPKTPRHRDALSKQPCTPKHRVIIGCKPLTPKTPRTPSAQTSNTRNIYSDLRKLFTRGSSPGALVGREKERRELEEFISTRVEVTKGGCIYVSGPPGTGKSALVTEICKEQQGLERVQYAYVNCMSIKSAGDICTTLADELDIALPTGGKATETALRAAFLNKRDQTTYLVTLDEIDALLDLDLSILYSLFEWAFAPSSRLILIGIANALDLTDRFLPKLKSRNLKPSLLPFLPYTASEISDVLTARCRSLLPHDGTAPADFVPVLHPSAIQLISKKVASQSGDLRKSFDIAQRVIDLIESETREKLAEASALATTNTSPIRSPLSDNPNLSSPTPRPTPSKQTTTPTLADLEPATAPRATLAHVIRITSAAFNTGTASRLSTLNLQQKAVLCALVALESRNRHTLLSTNTVLSPPQTPEKSPSKRSDGCAPSVRHLAQTYNTLCRRDNIVQALSGTEFKDVLGGLEAQGMVSWTDGKAKGTTGKKGRGNTTAFASAGGVEDRRISSCISEKEMTSAVEGPGAGVLRSILAGAGLNM